jgi:Fuc2NAc and GlcNAc transferase
MKTDVFLSLSVGSALVAGIGFIDDHNHVPPLWRLSVQLIAAIVALALIGGCPPIQIGKIVVDLGIGGDILAVIIIVWFTNAFNFMDGIDGIASSEAICIAGSVLILPSMADSGPLAALPEAVVAASLGFLVWNLPPAKIFMGDIGSGFLGFILALLAILFSSMQVTPIWSWLILAGVFVVDATITLVTRVINGEEWYSAHNNHAYQKASRRLKNHKLVTFSVLMINIWWLLPMAWFASARPEFGWWLTMIAWIPLILLSLFLKAGRTEPSA